MLHAAGLGVLLLLGACGATEETHKILDVGTVVAMTESEIRSKIRSGACADTNLVFRNGEWIPFKDDPDMTRVLAEARATPPPAAPIDAPVAPGPAPAAPTPDPTTGVRIPMAFVPSDIPMGLSTYQGGGYPLFDVPDVGIKVLPPAGAGRRFQGWIELGGKDRWLILDTGSPPKLYIDRNGNDDLTDDPGPFTGERDGDLPNHFTILPGPGEAPYRIWAFSSGLGGGLKYYAACHRAGRLPEGDEIALVLYDANADFNYENDGLVVDLNGNGQCDEGELIKVGESFTAAGRTRRLLAVVADGASIVLDH